MELKDRLKYARQQAKLTQSELADRAGIKQASVSEIERGLTRTSGHLIKIAQICGVDPTWLAIGIGSPRAIEDQPSGLTEETMSSADQVRSMLAKIGNGLSDEARNKILAVVEEPSAEPSNVIAADFSGLKARPEEILIPQYDIRAAMGHGQVPPDYNEAIRNLVVREDLLREKGVTYTSASALSVITGWGQSMEGTINDKDPVIVDRGVNEFIGEGVYVITWHDLLYIKRMQVADAENFWLISDNPKNKDQLARMEDVTIHAKVLLVWNANRL